MLAFEGFRAIGNFGKEDRARQRAVEGFAEQGGQASSTEFMRNSVRMEEALARRKTTMQQFEPELFQEVIRVLGDTGPRRDTLTTTERRIGADTRSGAQQAQGRSPKDIELLMKELFRQMGG